MVSLTDQRRMAPPAPASISDIYTKYPWLSSIRPEDRLLTGMAYTVAKRVFDLSVVLASAPAWLPVFLLCAVLVKAEAPSSSIFFHQKRTGKGGKRFSMIKFRTMVENAEELKPKLAEMNELQWPDFKIANDPRITKVGRILRKTSLDELPQILNVIRGEMSLVGPRPTSFAPNTYRLWHTERLDVLPGITGLWQILGRGATEFDERLRFDIAYIDRRCLWLDVQILIRTVISVTKQRGAH